MAAIERGKSEASYLNDKIQSMAQEPTTLRNYRRRHDELAKRCLLVIIVFFLHTVQVYPVVGANKCNWLV